MKHLALPLLLAATLAAGAAHADAVTLPQARSQFLAATAGDTAARDAAIESFARLAAEQPGHPVYLAYQGAALALKGRDAKQPWEKMKYAEQGADLVEKAVALLGPEHDKPLADGNPESIETRAVAASSLLALPEFLHRGAAGKRALQGALDSPLLEQASASTRASVYAAAARVAGNERRGADEAAWLKKIVALPATPAQRERAQARLKELGL
ncbi:hypothetical protein IP92_05343 [Pseudoduganella flava]|uniref:Tetratricopeptide repeat protein n=1 Tax=Pseudoduganella flava TaxID=871742 RepID=A0A562PF11_9BURK|nr:hypothetical protein [Pseudoduganella flava]QGZ38926.1 hypothetical protein GO485_07625 [Pseudoduganella flava]TWI43007.1 hypothetical protein IP92_05343 [Pseudoduganella flava]